MLRHVPKGLLHLLFMQPGPPPPSYSHGPLCHLLQENFAWSPFTMCPISHPSSIFPHRIYHHLNITFSPSKYCILFIACFPSLEFDSLRCGSLLYPLSDSLLVNMGVSAFKFPFSSPTITSQDHLLRNSREHRVTGKPVSLKEGG